MSFWTGGCYFCIPRGVDSVGWMTEEVAVDVVGGVEVLCGKSSINCAKSSSDWNSLMEDCVGDGGVSVTWGMTLCGMGGLITETCVMLFWCVVIVTGWSASRESMTMSVVGFSGTWIVDLMILFCMWTVLMPVGVLVYRMCSGLCMMTCRKFYILCRELLRWIVA